MIRLLTIFTAIFLINTYAYALEIGDKIPAIETIDFNKETRSFDDLKGKNGAIIFFIRSADWCPFCIKQLVHVGRRANEINTLGYNIINISYDSPEILKTFMDKYGFDYNFLSDKKSEIIKSFGALNENIPPKSSQYGIPHPVIFIVDENRNITDILEGSVMKRPPIENIVKSIKDQ